MAQTIPDTVLNATDVGVILTLVPQAGFSLNGLGCQLVIVGPINSPNSTRTVKTMAVAPDGKSASYTTDGTEFPVGGYYDLQLLAGTFSGDILRIDVGSRL